MAQIKKILCAVDFSEVSAKVAEYTTSLAKCHDAEVLVLYVAPSLSQYVGFHVPPSSIQTVVQEIVEGADKSMEGFMAERMQGVKATSKVATGYAAEEILNEADSEDVDLIIMGTHGRTGIDRIIFGSVAERVVKSASCPVLTIRPDVDS